MESPSPRTVADPLEELTRLRDLGRREVWQVDSQASRPVFRQLRKVADGLARTELRNARPRRPRLGLEEARQRWDEYLRTQDESVLTTRILANLCWDSEVVASAPFLDVVPRLLPAPGRRALRGMLWAYHSLFNHRPDALERLLARSLGSYGGSNRGLRALAAVQQLVVGETAPRLAALAIEEHGGTASAFLGELQLDHDARTPYERAVARHVLGRWLHELSKSAEANRVRELVEERIPRDRELLTPSGFANLVKGLVKVAGDDRAGPVREAIKTFVLTSNELGDPRQHPGRWTNKGLDAEAAAVRAWLSEEDLRFFFELLIDPRLDPHGRRDFWLRYVHRVRTSRVVVGRAHGWKHRVKLDQLKQRGRTFAEMEQGDTSAFVMDFGRVVCIEFSEVGNACYVYDARKFRELVPDLNRDTFRMRQLKMPGAAPARLRHDPSGRWVDYARDLLARFGIRD